MSQASASRVRGTAVGALTAALAVAAHGSGGGALPASTDIALLLVAAAVVGAVVAETAWLTRGRLPLSAALLTGQLLGHLVLAASAAGHVLSHSVLPSGPMLLAHVAAAVGCAVLIEVIERLYGPLTTLIRAATHRPSLAPAPPRVLPRRAVARPRRSLVALHSISRRGPPVLA